MKESSPFWHLTSVKALIFDWDGVLANTHLNFMGLKSKYFADEQAMLLEDSVRLSPALQLSLMKDLYQLELEGAQGATSIDGVADLLEYIQKNKIPWAVVSRNCRDAIHLSAKRVGVELPPYVGSRDDERVKPDPNALWRAADYLGVAYCDCAFVGDFKYDLIGARRASMRSVLVHRNEKGWEEWYDVYYPTLLSLLDGLQSIKPVIPWEYSSLVKTYGVEYLEKSFQLSIEMPIVDEDCSPESLLLPLSLGVGHVVIQKGRVLTPVMCLAHPTWDIKQVGNLLDEVVRNMLRTRFPMVSICTAYPREKTLPWSHNDYPQILKEEIRKQIEQL